MYLIDVEVLIFLFFMTCIFHDLIYHHNKILNLNLLLNIHISSELISLIFLTSKRTGYRYRWHFL